MLLLSANLNICQVVNTPTHSHIIGEKLNVRLSENVQRSSNNEALKAAEGGAQLPISIKLA